MIEALTIILYVLGSILLIVLIVLGIKLIGTLNKINNVVDDITEKVQTLNGFFTLVEYITDKVSSIGDVVVNFASSVANKIFNKKESEENNNE
ncbi:MAG: hypothetical protein IJO57_04165 [Bacilli bacterium]|nr:hypothetical protein [Bacilli bacterium]